MSPDPQPDAARERRRLRYPRPGHADLAGALKYGTDDLRNVLERASARETTARVAAGALARALLREAGVEVRSHVVRIGARRARRPGASPGRPSTRVEDSPVRCADASRGRGDDRRDRPREEGRRQRGRRRRGDRARRARRASAPSPSGTGGSTGGSRRRSCRSTRSRRWRSARASPAARRAAPPSTTRSSGTPRAGIARPDEPRRRARGRRHERRGDPRARGGEADPHAAHRRCARSTSRPRSRRRPRSSAATPASCRRPASWPRRCSRSCWPTRCSRRPGATRSTSSSPTSRRPARSSALAGPR